MNQELLFPRRRDIRDLAEWLLHALMMHYDNEQEKFDQNFLIAVRDLMRDGVPFMSAVWYYMPEEEPGPPTLAYDRPAQPKSAEDEPYTF